MIKIIIGFFVFCIILFFYLHIQFHLKTSDDLEIYEIEQASKDKIEEICDLRQPILFDCDYENKVIIDTTNKNYLLNNYPIFEIKIRENKDHGDLYVPLTLNVANKLFDEDKNGNYFSENNSDFLIETGAIKSFEYNDEFLRPYLVSNCNYDVMFASNDSTTPFRYEINYRNYFMVTQGSITVKLAPPKSSKYLYPINDYENFEFRSPINPWNIQSKYTVDFDKVKCLEIVLTPGKYLHIPPYWWYSFKFGKDSSVSSFKYRSYMNNITILPRIIMYALQNQNVKRETIKKIDISNLLEKKEDDVIGATSIENIDSIPVNNIPTDSTNIEDTLNLRVI